MILLPAVAVLVRETLHFSVSPDPAAQHSLNIMLLAYTHLQC